MLRRSYGAAEFYTWRQIETAIADAGLPMQYSRIAYAAYLPEAEFLQRCPFDDYQALRGLFARYAPKGATWPWEPAPETFAAMSGADVGGHLHH